jgi:excisionase family DNA binding protein
MKTNILPGKKPAAPRKAASVEVQVFPSLGFPTGRTILNVPEIAACLRVTKTHVYALIEDGTIQAINAGGMGRKYWRVPVEAFNEFVRQNHSYALARGNHAARGKGA